MEQGFAHTEKAREQNFVHLNQRLGDLKEGVNQRFDSLEKMIALQNKAVLGILGRDSVGCGEVPVFSGLIEGLFRGSVNECLCGSNELSPLVPRAISILEPGSASQARPERVSFDQRFDGFPGHRTFQLPHSPFEPAARRIPGTDSPSKWACRGWRMIVLPPKTSGQAVMRLSRSCSVVIVLS